MVPILTGREMRRLDERAIAELGLSGASLMEEAGRGAAHIVLEFLDALGRRPRDGRVVIVCGKGGNGGDGFVVARWLRRHRVRVRVLMLASPSEMRGAAAEKLAAMRRVGIRPEVIEDDARVKDFLASADLVVDALVGTGRRGASSGLMAAVIERINASGRPVVALDVPSGLPVDGGPLAGPAIRATLTVTFAALKLGLVTGPSSHLAGRIRVVPIGISPSEVARGATTFLIERMDVAPHFPPRRPDAHKGTYGHLLIVAGSVGKTGAAALAANAAMRSGVGLVTVGTAASQQPVVASLVLEAMTEPLPETDAQTVALKAKDRLVELVATRDAVALGPGLGLDRETQELARALTREIEKPLVLDADALSALAGHLDQVRAAVAPRCLTPHPGELARMLGVGVNDVQRDRVASAREFAMAHRAHVVLKGAMSVIGIPDGRVFVNPTGNPGMASGGTGDVLTGMVGAFLARGLDPAQALQAAVYLHGRAGDIAAERVGQEALVARDVIAALPQAFRELNDGGSPE